LRASHCFIYLSPERFGLRWSNFRPSFHARILGKCSGLAGRCRSGSAFSLLAAGFLVSDE
jgi:hypothetical protein